LFSQQETAGMDLPNASSANGRLRPALVLAAR
jgi:hypothetical protein